MKKILVLGLCILMSISLMIGCSYIKNMIPDPNAPETATQDDQQSDASEDPQASQPGSSEETETEHNKDVTTGVTTEPVEGLSDKYVDLDNRSFAVNGKVYTLGVNTLQDMIDDGVPFDENDIANANNNLNPDYESSGFKIVLGEYYSAQVFVGNFTENNKSAASCPLSSLYMPVHQDEEQNILQFSFPFSLTEEELIAQAGEPTDRDDYKSDDSDYESHTLEYTVDSEKYYGSSGYEFEFVNGELEYITIDWQL